MSGWDFSELTDLEEEILDLAQEFKNGREAKKFLRKSGTKLKNRTLKLAKLRVKKKTGNLFKGIKRGKPYKYYVDKSMAVRVYAGSPAYHAHLLNNGHRIVDKNGKEHGFAKGHHFFEDAADDYEEEYYDDVQGFIDELLDEHGF